MTRTLRARQRRASELLNDALSSEDLMEIGIALDGMPLITAGSDIALGLPQNLRKAGLLKAEAAADALDVPPGFRAVISGSCSVATMHRWKTLSHRDGPPLPSTH